MAEISDEVYESFSSSLIKDFQFSKLLKDNIKFVYLYLDKADSIEDNDEKEILYRELGSVVFSCLEALCKTVIDMIRKQCENHKCNNIGCCPYIAGLNSPHLIENAKTLDVISHLVQTRLFYLSPEQEHEIHLLRDQRNFIHLSKDIFAVNSYEFDENYVKRLLLFYFEILDQFDLNAWFFSKDNLCLKEVDSDDYASTKIMRAKEIKSFYTNKICMLFEKIFYKKDLSENDKLCLKRLSKKSKDKKCTNVDITAITKYWAKSIYFAKRHFLKDEDYKMHKENFYKTVSRYQNGEMIISDIKELLNACQKNGGVLLI